MLWFWPNIELLSRPNNTVTIFCSHGNLYISFYHATLQGVFLNWYDSLSFFFPKRVVNSFWNTFNTDFPVHLFMQVCFHGDNADFRCSSRQSFICRSTTQINSSACCDSPKAISSQAISEVFSVFEFSHTGIVCFSLKKSTKSLTPCRFRHMIWAQLHTD